MCMKIKGDDRLFVDLTEAEAFLSTTIDQIVESVPCEKFNHFSIKKEELLGEIQDWKKQFNETKTP